MVCFQRNYRFDNGGSQMSESQYSDRIMFHKELQVMEIDVSDLAFNSSRMVDEYYDEIERQVAEQDPKWYFLVNYKNCRIFELAWIRFAQRGKRLNLAHSLGSVRFSVADDLSESMETRAKSEHFDPNLFSSRDKALAEIERMKQVSDS